ncbi:MAG: glutathione-dependent formaldehyde dehydrogenase, partial [Candidatus Eremiobacteraeota bacterium]|nr:glutathione-dependent formaldehyde dehydrogenase [Candidatus Eremiobacteraeota bacterium]
AVVWHGIGDIRLDDVPDPRIEQPTDAVVRLTASAICGTDLHFVRGTFSGMKPGTILGHEGVGVVEHLGDEVRNFDVGDRVVICSTIACGVCSYCRASYYSKCDRANPAGPQTTAFYGGPTATGPFDGLQAEYARIPYANVGPVKLPDDVSDEDAILLSDIFPTAYFGAEMASVKPGHTVAVLGCGPVGQLTIASAMLLDAGRVFAIDCEQSRLETTRAQGAECIDFSKEDPVEVITELTDGSGVDCVVDAVGIDAQSRKPSEADAMKPGKAPGQALEWAIEIAAKAAHVAIIGVYPPTFTEFAIGKAMGRNLTLRMGDCPHRRYLPMLVRKVSTGEIRPSKILTQRVSIDDAVAAYDAFAKHESGWLKVELLPATPAASERGEIGAAAAARR